MTQDRVIVVQDQFEKNVIKVLDSWESYDEWVEGDTYGWDESDLVTCECKVSEYRPK